MKRKLIIFGNKDFAQLANHYMLNDPYYHKRYEVVGYTVNREYKTENFYNGKILIPFENIENHCPPEEYSLFIPVSDNTLRNKLYLGAKSKGYEVISYISSYCTNFAWKIGENCFILEECSIQPFVNIGNNFVCWSNSHIGHHSTIEDNVFITSNVTISGHCHIKKGSFFGVGSCIRDGITIGENSIVGMGSAVVKSIPDNETWIGNPAKKYK